MEGFNYDSATIQENTEAVYEMGTLTTATNAKHWYPNAHEYAIDFSRDYNKSIEITSAIISVLSPQKDWFHNLVLAKQFLDSGGTKAGHTGTQVKKAKYIYNLEETTPWLVNTYIEIILGGQKTANFFHNILNPEDEKYVTIDSHMLQLMTGNMIVKKITKKQYEFLKGEILKFAKRVGKLPSEVQAELWLIFKENKWNGKTKGEEQAGVEL